MLQIVKDVRAMSADQTLPQNHWGIDKRINLALIVGLLIQIAGGIMLVGIGVQRLNNVESRQDTFAVEQQALRGQVNQQAIQMGQNTRDIANIALRVDRTVTSMDKNNELLQDLLREVYTQRGERRLGQE